MAFLPEGWKQITLSTRVKICGITNLEDARAAIEFGADSLGFNFAPESPRFVRNNPNFLKELAYLPPFVSRVALCTTHSSMPIELLYLFDTIQFYPPDFIRIPGKNHFQAYRMKDESSLAEIEATLGESERSTKTPLNAILLDAYHKDKLGGSGEKFNWDLALEAKRRFQLPLILAGGLDPENVREATEKVRPYAVDVSSGVESEPGIKDHAKMRAFIHAAKSILRCK